MLGLEVLASLITASLVSATSGKRGLCWPSTNTQNPSVFKSPQITWLYDWGVSPPALLNGQLPFYPMQWNSANIASLASEVAADDATYVLGFNEPDNAGQANMTPASAASYWIEYIQPLKAKGYKLVSPAFTYGGAPAGIAWMDDFVAACTGCTFDAIAMHWYGGWTTDLESYVNETKKYNAPIWLTEFGLDWGSDYPAQASNYLEFLPLALEYLDNEPAVEKYAFFGDFYSGGAWDMLYANGTLNALGEIYVAN